MDMKEVKEAIDNSGKKSSTPSRKVKLINEFYTESVSMNVEVMYDDVVLPSYAHKGDACMDLRANNIISIKNEMGMDMPIPEKFDKIEIHQGWIVLFGTGLKIELPKGFSSDLKIRSGLSLNEGLVILNSPAKIDCPYTGEYIIGIGKINKKPTIINKNDRIAQFEPSAQCFMELNIVESVKAKSGNERGDKGLGSSGLK